MEVKDIGILIPAIIPTTAATKTMKFLKKKVLKFLRANKTMGIGILRPSTLHQVMVEVMNTDIFDQTLLLS